MFKNKKVIIFDMDGTLIDSIGVWNQVDAELILKLAHISVPQEELQMQRDEKLREYRSMENPYVSYCGYLGQKYHLQLPPEEILSLRNEIADDFLVHKIDYKPYADVLLRKLKDKNYKLVIATTTRRKNMDIYRFQNENLLRKAPINEYFSLVYTSEDVSRIKPDPEIYLKVMDTLQVRADECLIFEDSLVGIEAACNAGIEAVGVYDKYSDHEQAKIRQKAAYCVEGYEEILERVD